MSDSAFVSRAEEIRRELDMPWLTFGPSAYRDGDPEVVLVRAELLVYGMELDPDRVTHVLGVAPTQAGRRGDVSTNSQGRQRTVRLNHWFLSSEPAVQSTELRRHLDWLLERLDPVADAVHELSAPPETWVLIKCLSWWKDSGVVGLEPAHLQSLAKLSIPIEIGFAAYPDEAGDPPRHVTSADDD
jgi:hypothetical protein